MWWLLTSTLTLASLLLTASPSKVMASLGIICSASQRSWDPMFHQPGLVQDEVILVRPGLPGLHHPQHRRHLHTGVHRVAVWYGLVEEALVWHVEVLWSTLT